MLARVLARHHARPGHRAERRKDRVERPRRSLLAQPGQVGQHPFLDASGSRTSQVAPSSPSTSTFISARSFLPRSLRSRSTTDRRLARRQSLFPILTHKTGPATIQVFACPPTSPALLANPSQKERESPLASSHRHPGSIQVSCRGEAIPTRSGRNSSLLGPKTQREVGTFDDSPHFPLLQVGTGYHGHELETIRRRHRRSPKNRSLVPENPASFLSGKQQRSVSPTHESVC